MQTKLKEIAKNEPQILLTAFGGQFQPDLFLEDSAFDRRRVLYYGGQSANRFEWVGEGYGREKKLVENQVLIIGVSRTGTRGEQIEKAVKFLRFYRDEILRLAKFPGVEMVVLTRARAREETDSSIPGELLEEANRAKVSLMV